MTLSAAKNKPADPERPARPSARPPALFRLPASTASGKPPKSAKAAKTEKPAKVAKVAKSESAKDSDLARTTKTDKPSRRAKSAKPTRPPKSARPAKSTDSGTSNTSTRQSGPARSAATSTDLFAARVPTSGSVMGKAALIFVVSTLLFGLAYYIAVRTTIGQRFEDAVWIGSNEIGQQRPVQASDALNRIDKWSAAAALAAVFLIGLMRRRIALALTGVAVVGASVATAELIKDRLSRPDLVPGAFNAGNSFPSGHTAVAMALMFALILVVPYRIRGLIAFCTAVAATGIGALTIVARWHRPSDTFGADLIVLAYASLAVLILAAFGHVRPATLRFSGTKAVRSIFVLGPIAVGTLLCLIGAMVFAVLTFYHPVQLTAVSSSSRAAFIAGCLLALAGSGLVTLVLMWLLGRLDLVPPLARRAREAQN
jgi:membrane-associated phospholipid phosphatase